MPGRVSVPSRSRFTLVCMALFHPSGWRFHTCHIHRTLTLPLPLPSWKFTTPSGRSVTQRNWRQIRLCIAGLDAPALRMNATVSQPMVAQWLIKRVPQLNGLPLLLRLFDCAVVDGTLENGGLPTAHVAPFTLAAVCFRKSPHMTPGCVSASVLSISKPTRRVGGRQRQKLPVPTEGSSIVTSSGMQRSSTNSRATDGGVKNWSMFAAWTFTWSRKLR